MTYSSFAQDNGSPDIAWRPTPEYTVRSRLRHFMLRHGLHAFGQLVERYSADPAWFWQAVVEDLGLEWYEPYTQVLDLSRGVEWARWFVGGSYNYVRDAVDEHAVGPLSEATAIAWEGEDGEVRKLTYAKLYRQVNQAANALRSLGIGRGDRVGVYMPMLPETAIAVLAISKIGAIYTPIFSGYGGAAVASRLQDCGAKLLVTADGFYRGGKWVPMIAASDEAVAASPTVEHMLVVSRHGDTQDGGATWTPGRDIWWHELVGGQAEECETVRTAADEPYMIIYTSGTTGRPKGVVHLHAGFPVKAAQELAHCFDLHQGEVLYWISDIGWMMGPWAITGSLMLGATCFLYEGSISHPQPDRVWSLVERHRITHLGISPTAVRSLMGQGDRWVQAHDLSSLLFLAGAGEPWNPGPWQWLFDVVGERKRPIINYSGGTEVSGGILSCNPLLPIKPCAFSGPVPGMLPDVVDTEGKPMRQAVGELALKLPWVGKTEGFWGDEERYIDTYWSRVPGMWVHGDWARVDEDGFWYILGRSDDTIKVAGKRVGPAEVESAAVSHPAVAEAAAIGVPDALKGESLVVLVALRPGHAPGEGLRQEIESCIVAHLGKSLKPHAIKFVTELPHTRNGKMLRRLVRQGYLGEPPGDLSALENPSALEAVASAF
ncbi:MAG: AMP-binding protein [Chloroflexota bacterium]|nr:AMP-binding protein [Chloroflexota bacterium]MDQ5866816.1 AMP-binding protein [Chloroflexota bacterium]